VKIVALKIEYIVCEREVLLSVGFILAISQFRVITATSCRVLT
jgi:hypothetical protein